jgi:serine phosphatase RsbU (regulator of sigma subunit)
MSSCLSDHFIHLKETELIGGDLAYARCTKDASFIAAIDCTGHGIPGAMLSMMAYSYLDEIILQLKVEEPASILNSLNKMMYCALRSKNEDIKDGLDISLLRVDHSKSKVSISSARRPVIHIPNGKMHIYAGTKASIAESDKSSFEQIDLEVKAGHKFYLFSDGITDQFGGPKDKKFGRKRLTHLLAAIKDLHMPKQYEIINNTLESWQGTGEQTDDQVMIGIKV